MKKRILVLLSVVALMVVMMAMSVAPAFAAWNPAGCRGQDELTNWPTGVPPDGKRTTDGEICVHERVREHQGDTIITISFYDNRDVV